MIAASERDEFFQNENAVSNGNASTQPDDTQSTSNTINARPENDRLEDELNDTIDDDIISVGTNERSQLTQSESIVSKLDEILIRIAAIEKFQAKSEVRLRNIENFMERCDNGTSANTNDADECANRSQLGLPVKTVQSMDKLEQDLATEEKKQQYVRN